jgi:hypothetical protein
MPLYPRNAASQGVRPNSFSFHYLAFGLVVGSIKSFGVRHCTSFWFELMNPKMFEMEFLKMTHYTYLVIFYLKFIFCPNFNLPHTYHHHPKKNPFVIQ